MSSYPYMTGFKRFAADNWFSILTASAVIAGAVWQLGFKERDYKALADYAAETRAIQNTKIREFEQFKQDVERLKWELGERKVTIEEIKLDVRDTRRSVGELEKRMEVVIELLKPRTVGVVK